MSFIGSMVAVGVLGLEAGSLAAIATGAAVTGAAGAGLGAGIGALTGGDIGDAALMGGIGGILSGGMAGVAGAGAAAGGGAAGATGGAASQAITPAMASLAPEAASAGGAMGSLGAATSQAVTPAMFNIAPAAATSAGQLGAAGTSALSSTLPAASSFASQGAAAVAPSLSIGQQAVQSLTGAAADSGLVQYGGSALQGMATGAGVQGISNAVTGRPLTEGMGTSALAGGVGGAAATGLAAQAGQPGMMGEIGKFAAEHNVITPAGIGLLATPMISSMVDGSGEETPQPSGIKANFKYNPAAYRRTAYPVQYAQGGGISSLGDYSDGGRLLKGPGDGVSDDIPAIIGGKEPARLAEGEFVVPARIVSELGNGSTDAGAKQLYAMMDRVQNARHKTMGKGKFSEDTRAAKLLPA